MAVLLSLAEATLTCSLTITAMQEKTARLKALRLARDAANTRG
jgi:hypothetical protein